MSGVKCTSRRIRILSLILALCFLTGCGKTSYELAYSAGGVFAPTRYGVEVSRSRAVSFASSLCVAEGDVIPVNMEEINAGAAGLFDLKNKEVLYAKGVHEKMYPASLTKVMTAIVALENGSLDQVLEATDKVKITESGAATAKLVMQRDTHAATAARRKAGRKVCMEPVSPAGGPLSSGLE